MTTSAAAQPGGQAEPLAEVTRFEIREGSQRIPCSVSDEALEAVAGLAAPSTPSQRRESFSRFRTLIHEAARMKAEALAGEWSGKTLILGSADLRRVPEQAGIPKFGVAQRQKSVQ